MERPAGYAAFGHLLDEEPSDELFRAAKVVQDLEGHPGWSVLQELLARKRDFIADGLTIADRVFEQAHYARQHGVLLGLRMATDAAKALEYAAQEREQNMPERVALAERE